MNNKPSEFSQLLDADKPPSSPEALDQKILDYARVHAPKKPARAGWMPILATASVACIALLFVVQQPQQTIIDDHSLSAGFEQDFSSEPALEEVIDSAQKQEGMAAPSTASTANAISADAVAAQADNARQRVATAERKQRSAAKKAAPMALMAETESAPVAKPAVPDVESVLIALQDLLQAGEQVQAYADYEALKTRCPQCDLPDQLEDALNNLPR